jgi:hypothetical protein
MRLRDAGPLTIIVPFYRNISMLAEQVRTWNEYPDGFEFVVVDDGSPELAAPIILENGSERLAPRLSLYRIDVDIPWNRGGARNLGAQEAKTKWIMHVDVDHVMPAHCAAALLDAEVSESRWYRFHRFRNGAADETRRKDEIPHDQVFGKIKPHCDSYLCTREMFWKAGGYNEDFSGCLGGGTPLLIEMGKQGPVDLLPEPIALHVYTRSVVADASDHTLSRDTSEFTRRKRTMRGNFRGHNPIRFPWSKVL